MNSKSYPIWLSHSSIGDFLKCPRAYFLHNVYKDPKTNHKINIINPPLALGQVVHDVLDSISDLECQIRFKNSLLDIFENKWSKVTGELGGFESNEEEKEYKVRGKMMIKNIMDHPGPLLNKAVRLLSSDSLPPRFTLSQKENIILCGKVDWLEYFSADDSIHILDFKTGKYDEEADSLQLPIYFLLVKNCQNRKVKKISYWYLERGENPTELSLPNLEDAYRRVIEVALRVKHARIAREYSCPRNGCYACKPFEAIISKKGKYISSNDYQDIYTINRI